MKKIMFNDKYGLTQAVLDGLKTMTRRIVNNKLIDAYNEWRADVDSIALPSGSRIETLFEYSIKRTSYQVGEVVAIAQSYKDSGYTPDSLDRHPKDLSIRSLMKDSAGWNNKMFVRADSCKNHIKITEIKAERLQDISDEDCLKEGVFCFGDKYVYDYPNGDSRMIYNTPREAFAALIDKVSGKGTWESNPFVWAYEFELVD